MNIRSTSLSCAIGALAICLAQQPAIAQDANAASAKGSDLEEIVVTASRRSEIIRNIPTAVSAYAGDKLREAQQTNLAVLFTSSPNVQLVASLTNANISIRGIGNTQTQAGADAGVAVHVDGVYLAESGLAITTFLDLARVEVLRGPQGTLFGRNATGGAINLIPNTPTENFEAGVNSSIEFDPMALKSSAFVSGPITSDGRLRGRFAVQQNFNKGDTKNLLPTGPRRLDNMDDVSARAQLEFQPVENFKTRLLAEYMHGGGNGKAGYLVAAPNQARNALVSPTDPTVVLPAILVGAPIGNPDAHTTYANDGQRDVEAKMVNLTTDWGIAGGNLKSLLSYHESDYRALHEDDGTGAPHSTTSYRNLARQDYQELIYTSDASKPFNFVLGANHFHQRLQQDASVPISTLPAATPAVNLGGVIFVDSYAGFAHANLEVIPGFKLFGGIRYSHDKKKISDYNNFAGTRKAQASWSKVTYEGGVSHQFSPNVTGYAKYATGYKGGGYSAGNLQPAFNPENNRNIEVGLKGSYLDGLLQANIAVFHMKYKDLQVSQVIGVSGSVVNAARATVKGTEVELVVRPLDNLRLDLSGGYLDAKFDEFFTRDSARPNLIPDVNAAGQPGIQLAGNRLPLSPEFTGSASIAYDVPLSDGSLTFGAKYDYKTKVYFSSFNIDLNGQKAVGKVDVSVRYRSENQRWTASIYALNLMDKKIKSYENVVSGLVGGLGLAQYFPGRQVGVSLGYKY